MTLVKEVVDMIDLIAKSVDNMQKIADAVRTGVGYLKAKHPEASDDLLAMCQEITKTLDALAVASSVVTRFSFTVSGTNLDREPRVFNDYFIAHAKDAREVKNRIEILRGHCHKIKEYADRMTKTASGVGLSSLFNLLNVRSAEQETELADRLQQIYDEEQEFYLIVDGMSSAVEGAFEDVQRALGPPGAMIPENVPVAAKLLGEYAVKFGDLQSRCVYAAGELKEML